MKLKIKRRIVSLFLSVLLIFSLLAVWGNTALELNEYTVCSAEIPAQFSGFRIAHVSDVHNTEIGEDNEKLLSVLRESEPDIIAITGDLIDSRNTDVEIALSFAEKAVQIAPCYYVTGNHEARVAEYDELKKRLVELGVKVLDNKRLELEKNGEAITFIGVDDPDFTADYLFDDSKSVIEMQMQRLYDEDNGYTVLLSHRPELFDVYSENGADLILSGHAHGGQFRIPGIGGIYAPHQGFFPEYDAGVYIDGDTSMIVSRGIGNSIFPLRVNNRPEVVLIELSDDLSAGNN